MGKSNYVRILWHQISPRICHWMILLLFWSSIQAQTTYNGRALQLQQTTVRTEWVSARLCGRTAWQNCRSWQLHVLASSRNSSMTHCKIDLFVVSGVMQCKYCQKHGATQNSCKAKPQYTRWPSKWREMLQLWWTNLQTLPVQGFKVWQDRTLTWLAGNSELTLHRGEAREWGSSTRTVQEDTEEKPTRSQFEYVETLS